MITKQELIEAFKEGYKCARDKSYIDDNETGLIYSVRLTTETSVLGIEKEEFITEKTTHLLGIPFTKKKFDYEHRIYVIRYGTKTVSHLLTKQEHKELSDFVKLIYDKWEKERNESNDKILKEELKKFKNCDDGRHSDV